MEVELAETEALLGDINMLLQKRIPNVGAKHAIVLPPPLFPLRQSRGEGLGHAITQFPFKMAKCCLLKNALISYHARNQGFATPSCVLTTVGSGLFLLLCGNSGNAGKRI